MSGAMSMGYPVIGLAPMAGLTDRPMRAISYRLGANYACSEMISAIGWMCAKPGNPIYHHLLSVAPEESNTAIQLFGKDPSLLKEAAARATEMKTFSSIDINMGCPVRKVVSSGEGSALMKTPDLAIRLMESVKEGTSLPVTVKMRLGFDQNSMTALQLTRAAEEIGIEWVCIHGRTREQMFSGQANPSAVAEIKKQVNIPVLYNGDIATAEDAMEALDSTGCDGILIGRGAMGNPWLFGEIQDALSGKPLKETDSSQRLQIIEDHIDRMVAFKGERLAVLQMRTHIGHYIRGMRGASAIRRELNTVSSSVQQKALLRRIYAKEMP